MSSFQEIKPGMIELMKPKMTFAQSEIQDGDVICFQVEISEKESVGFKSFSLQHTDAFYVRTHDLESQGLYSNPMAFYDFLQNRVMITFKPKFDETDENLNPEFYLVLSKKMTYDHVCSQIVMCVVKD